MNAKYDLYLGGLASSLAVRPRSLKHPLHLKDQVEPLVPGLELFHVNLLQLGLLAFKGGCRTNTNAVGPLLHLGGTPAAEQPALAGSELKGKGLQLQSPAPARRELELVRQDLPGTRPCSLLDLEQML